MLYRPIENHGIIGNMGTVALAGRVATVSELYVFLFLFFTFAHRAFAAFLASS